ncbi:MAG: ATP cone domain-containing protein [Planctomycetota bacterium]
MISAVIKHDGRTMTFDAARLEASVARAVRAADASLPPNESTVIAQDVAASIEHSTAVESSNVVRTADIRATIIDSLRAMALNSVAEAYQKQSRDTMALLQRIRVIEPDISRSDSSGVPWDRRRLAESLHASGIAPDVAKSVARDVERRIVALGQQSISPALIHALTELALPPGAFGARTYSVRRVAYSAANNLPHFKSEGDGVEALPANGPALETFWLQGVHSSAVVNAVRSNLIALDPCPSTHDAHVANAVSAPFDPLAPDFEAVLWRRSAMASTGLAVRADSPERIRAIAEQFARGFGNPAGTPMTGTEIHLYYKSIPEKYFDASHRALPVTINAGGLVAREGLRDPKRAAARLGELAELAAQVHREREDYFLRSPVRGRVLPIAVAGLWNATSWMQGARFDAERAAIGVRNAIEPLCQSLRAAVENLRSDSGLELVLTAAAPLRAEQRLWRGDRDFFLNDGVKLNADAIYDSGRDMKLSASMHDFTNRLDFAHALSEAFDEPPAMTLETGLALDINAAQWNDLLTSLAQAGVGCLRIAFGGQARTVPNLIRAIRSYLIGFPLLDVLDNPNIVGVRDTAAELLPRLN